MCSYAVQLLFWFEQQTRLFAGVDSADGFSILT